MEWPKTESRVCPDGKRREFRFDPKGYRTVLISNVFYKWNIVGSNSPNKSGGATDSFVRQYKATGVRRSLSVLGKLTVEHEPRTGTLFIYLSNWSSWNRLFPILLEYLPKLKYLTRLDVAFHPRGVNSAILYANIEQLVSTNNKIVRVNVDVDVLQQRYTPKRTSIKLVEQMLYWNKTQKIISGIIMLSPYFIKRLRPTKIGVRVLPLHIVRKLFEDYW
jgi:hypothetical protein